MTKPTRSRWRRRLGIAGVVALASTLALWIAIHRVAWLGPMLADGAREVVGPEAVAFIEDVAYTIDDHVQRLFRGDEAPEAYWDVPATPADPPAPIAEDAGVDAAAAPRALRPADVAPIYPEWAAPGDGVWVAVPDAQRPDAPPLLWKTLLHPDRVRAWAAVSIVAVDLEHADLHLVAGRYEPAGSTKEALAYERPAVIPARDHASLLGAFNGGFKAVHGHYGMRIDGVTLLPARKDACAVAMLDDGTLKIASWSAMSAIEAQARWWRQTPGCMFEGGAMHKGLTVDQNTYWGSKIGGDTVIRRSAIGLDASRRMLFVGIGDSMSAPSLAKALHHAGAADIAQLDVNWSFPKFLLYEPREPGSSELVARPLCKGFELTDDEYVRERSPRDFFYLTRKSETPL